MSCYYSKDKFMREVLVRILARVGSEEDLLWLEKTSPKVDLYRLRKITSKRWEAMNEEKALAVKFTYSIAENLIAQWATDSMQNMAEWSGSPGDLHHLFASQRRLSGSVTPQQFKTVAGKVLAQSTNLPLLFRTDISSDGKRNWIIKFLKPEPIVEENRDPKF